MGGENVISRQRTIDEDLQQRVVSYLFDRQRPSLRKISVNVDNGTVTLTGKLDSFYEKQLCISSCQRVAGVIRLIDRLDVVDTPRTVVG